MNTSTPQNLYLLADCIDHNRLVQYLHLIGKLNSNIVLYQDAVYLLHSLSNISKIDNLKVYAVDDDLKARGINIITDNPTINLINYKKFVDLTISHNKIITL